MKMTVEVGWDSTVTVIEGLLRDGKEKEVVSEAKGVEEWWKA